MLDYLPLICSAIILIIALYYFIKTIDLRGCANAFSNASEISKKLTLSPRFMSLMNSYKKNINIEVNGSKKTNHQADEFIRTTTVCNVANINLRSLEAGSNILIGLGLLGTFAGLSLGLSGIDARTSNTQELKEGIDNLLNGASTAFISSLVGMTLSVILSFFQKSVKNKLVKNLSLVCEILDETYYIDDNSLSNLNQQKIFSELYKTMKADMDDRNQLLVNQLESVKNAVASPATDMVEGIIDRLGESLEKMMGDFKTSLSGSAMKEMENLAETLGTATHAMAQLPQNMEDATNALKTTISEVKTSINDITKNATESNNEAFKTMQKQLLGSANTMNETIGTVANLMEQITETTQRNNQQMAEQIAEQTAKMNAFVNNIMAEMQTAMKQAITTSMNDMGNQQQKMLEVQEGTIEETRELIEAFNNGIDHMKEVSDGVTNTIETFQKMQSQIKGTTNNLETISSNLKSAYDSFNKMQLGYTNTLSQLQERSELSLEKVTFLLKNSGEMGDEYVRKFDMIKLGLAAIFEQVQTGLLEYSKTVKESTQKYLNDYSTSLTNTTDSLKSCIAEQSEVVEMLTELLNKKK